MPPTPIDSSEIQSTIGIIVASRTFHGLRRVQEFLAFIVSETLAGRGAELKEHTIGVVVYHRPSDYDPKLDAIVRVEAVKLRRRLDLFYEKEARESKF